MALRKSDAPANAGAQPTQAQAANQQTAPLHPDKNPNPAPQGPAEVIEAAEHVIGTDPRRTAEGEAGYHDSLSGRAVDSNGRYVDGQGEGEVPAHRIVANDWVTRQNTKANGNFTQVDALPAEQNDGQDHSKDSRA
jgi:hypothetical protein